MIYFSDSFYNLNYLYQIKNSRAQLYHAKLFHITFHTSSVISNPSIYILSQINQLSFISITDYSCYRMSNSKKQSREPRIRNYSFSSQYNSNINHSQYDKAFRQPLRETEIIHNYSPSKFLEESNLKPPSFTPPTDPSTQTLYILHQQEEIRKLEEVIYYITCDKDMLKQDCLSLQIQVNTMTNNYTKQKENYQAEIRKLKEIIIDKESQCDSIARASKKQKEIYQQEHQRMNVQLKSIIEKKNDEIYSITREKEIENQQIRKTLQATMQEIRMTHSKQVKGNDQEEYLRLNEEIKQLRLKNQQFELEKDSNQERYQSQKFRLMDGNQAFLSELKENYHIVKMKILKASNEEVELLQANSQMERQAYRIEIDQLKNLNQIHKRQNQSLHTILFQSSRQNQQDIHGLNAFIKQLQLKLSTIHREKQKQIQYIKIKLAHLHSKDLQTAEEIYSTKITHLLDKLSSIEVENARLRKNNEDQKLKNSNLIKQLYNKDVSFQQELSIFKYKQTLQCENLKDKYESQKLIVIQQNTQVARQIENKEILILSQQQQLIKLRKLLNHKSTQVQNLEGQINQIRSEINEIKSQKANENNSKQLQWNEERLALASSVEAKARQIQKLNNSLLQIMNKDTHWDYSHLQNQIMHLRQQLKVKNRENKEWREKAQALTFKAQGLQKQKQLLKQSSNSRPLEQTRIEQRIKEIQTVYKRQIQSLIYEKNQSISENQEQSQRFAQLLRKYQELSNNFKQVLSSLTKRTQLQNKIISLGLDTNLVKSKQQLFEY